MCVARVAQKPRRLVCTASVASNPDTAIYERLKGRTVIRSSDGQRVELVSLWSPKERAVVAFARSLG